MTAGRVRIGEGALDGVGGVQLRYRTVEVQRPRAAILLVHGLGEHSGRYVTFGRHIAASGFSTYAYDQRGHGLSEGRRGHTPAFDALLQDLDRFRREVQGLIDPQTPLFLVGQSMGGLVVLRYLEEFDGGLRGAVAMAPWLATAMPIPRWKATLAGVLERILPALPVDNEIDERHLSRDPEVVEAYRDDPLVHRHITPRLFAEAARAMGLVMQRSDRIAVPLLFLLPGADRIVDTQRTLAFARSLRADSTVKVYPGHYHELLNEPDGASIARDLRDWMAARLH